MLRLAREVVKPDGAIVVCEAPNRLIYFDHHTAQMPFFHLLPDELAARVLRDARSERTSRLRSTSAAERGRDAALQAIVRWGRGISFHEFEVVFGDLSRHVIASNYDPLLFGERPVHPDEVILARYLERWRPDLAPAWSRYWLDLILSPQPVERRQPFVRPWTADTVASTHVGWTSWENLYLGDQHVEAVDRVAASHRPAGGGIGHSTRAMAVAVRASGGCRCGPARGARGRPRARCIHHLCVRSAGAADRASGQRRVLRGVRGLPGLTGLRRGQPQAPGHECAAAGGSADPHGDRHGHAPQPLQQRPASPSRSPASDSRCPAERAGSRRRRTEPSGHGRRRAGAG